MDSIYVRILWVVLSIVVSGGGFCCLVLGALMVIESWKAWG